VARREIAETLGIVVVGLVAYAIAPTHGDRAWIGLLLGLAAVAVIIPTTRRRIRSIATSERPIVEAIQATVLVVTFLVLGFSAVYVSMSDRGAQLVGVETKVDGLYFTMSILSTVGFGDAHARGQFARLVVTIQMVFDLAVFAAAIRLLGGTARRRATEVGTLP
jgi:voltage-gated potassium channel